MNGTTMSLSWAITKITTPTTATTSRMRHEYAPAIRSEGGTTASMSCAVGGVSTVRGPTLRRSAIPSV